MQEGGFELEDLDSGSKKYAATQVLLNGYLAESAFAMGDANRYLDTYLGKQTGLKATLLDVSRLFGEGITPAFAAFTDVMKTAAVGLQGWLGENKGKIKTLATAIGVELSNVIESVKNFFERNKDIFKAVFNFVIMVGSQMIGEIRKVWNSVQILANGLEFAVRSIVNAGKILYSAVTGDWKGVAGAYDEWLNKSSEIQGSMIKNMEDYQDANKQVMNATKFDISKWWGDISEISESTREGMEKSAKDSNAKISADDIKTLEKIAKENEKYKREVEKRAKDFSESFDDLIIEHRDTIQQLTSDLSEESKDYQKKVVEMLDEYNDSMEDIKKSHADKTKSIMADMEAETAKAKEEIEKLNEAYGESVGLIQKEGEDRIGNLQVQLDKEKALGELANAEKIVALEEMIAAEQEGLAGTVDDMTEKHDEEVADVNETLAEKIALIKTELDEENLAYEEALAERKVQYDKDVADAKESYEEKRNELQKELDAEVVIREKYAEDFKRVGDRIALDDITRLVNKNAEEKAEAERAHLETLAELKGNSFENGEATINSFSAGVDSAYPALKTKLDQIKTDISSVSESVSNFSGGNIGNPWGLTNLGVGTAGSGGGGTWAQGGLVTQPGIVGEAGPEIVLPLSFPKRMAQIIQSMGLGGNGGGGKVTQNFYVTVNNAQDVDLLMERAGFAMKTQGGLT
jgi:hypothetical protein